MVDSGVEVAAHLYTFTSHMKGASRQLLCIQLPVKVETQSYRDMQIKACSCCSPNIAGRGVCTNSNIGSKCQACRDH